MHLKQTLLAVSTGLALASLSMGSLACTTLIVGKNVSETGRVMVGHTEDAGGRVLHQEFFYPAQKHWDEGTKNGSDSRAQLGHNTVY